MTRFTPDDRDAAFTAFVRARGRSLARSAFLIAGDVCRAEDVLQTALAETYLRWETLRHPGAAEAYVRRVIVTVNAGWWRRRWRDEVPHEVLPDRAVPDQAHEIVDRQVLMTALRELSARQRAVIVLRYFDDLSERDTADALGCSSGSVKRHTSRALERLRELIVTESEVIGADPATRLLTAQGA
jgi:RNA polymerase sigma-70 factor (sigma-E family)